MVEKVSVLLIAKVSNLTLAGYMSNSHAPKNAKIVCMKPATLVFFKIVNLVIKNLSIIYCGYPFLNNGEHWIFRGSQLSYRAYKVNPGALKYLVNHGAAVSIRDRTGVSERKCLLTVKLV